MFLTHLQLQYPLLGHLAYFLKDFLGYLILITISIFTFIFSIYKVHKRETTETKKKIIIAACCTVFCIIILFTACEAYFRYRYNVSDGLGFLRISTKWDARHVRLNNEFMRDDKNLEEKKTEGVIRIGVLGDSITFGRGIENVNNRFSNILEKKLKDTGKNVEIFNLGRPGYDTDSEATVYDGLKHYNFDILIWEYFINDAQPGDQSTGTPIIENNRKKAKIISFISDRSYFLDFVYWRLSSKYQKTFQELRTADIAQYSNEPVITQHKEDVKKLLKNIQDQNTRVVVIMFPSNVLLGPNYPTYVHEMMGNVFKENGALFYDLLDDLKDRNGKELMASKFDPHPNEIENKIAADKLYELLLEKVFNTAH